MISWTLLVGFLLAAWGDLALATTTALPLHASSLEPRVLPREAPPRGWPVVGRQSMPRPGEHWDKWGGMPRRHLSLTVPELTLLLPWAVMDYWVELRADEREGHSCAVRYR